MPPPHLIHPNIIAKGPRLRAKGIGPKETTHPTQDRLSTWLRNENRNVCRLQSQWRHTQLLETEAPMSSRPAKQSLASQVLPTHSGGLHSPALGQTAAGVCSLNRSPSASSEKTRPQKFQPKVATNITAPRSGFVVVTVVFFLPHGAFLSTQGSGVGGRGWGAVRHRVTKKQRRGQQGPAEPLHASVYSSHSPEGQHSVERPQGIATKTQKNHKCVK